MKEIHTIPDAKPLSNNKSEIIKPKIEFISIISKEKSTNNKVIVIEDDEPLESVIEITEQDVTNSVKITNYDQPDLKNDASSSKTDQSEENEENNPSNPSESRKLFNEFIEKCKYTVKGTQYEERITKKLLQMRKLYEEYENECSDPDFNTMLLDYIKTAAFSPADSVVVFCKLYRYLADNARGPSIEVEESILPKLKKLEKFMKKLERKIKNLDTSEVDLNDDNSPYVMKDRYVKRLVEVYKKYCQLLKKKPETLGVKILFMNSKYNEINRAITKSFTREKFPSYYEVEKCIKQCVNENNLGLSDLEILTESKHCFEKLGNLLQYKRKNELYENHMIHLSQSEDPANGDKDLSSKLQESRKEGDLKMKTVIEKYVQMQEQKVEVELSEESEDSDRESSDEGDD